MTQSPLTSKLRLLARYCKVNDGALNGPALLTQAALRIEELEAERKALVLKAQNAQRELKVLQLRVASVDTRKEP